MPKRTLKKNSERQKPIAKNKPVSPDLNSLQSKTGRNTAHIPLISSTENSPEVRESLLARYEEAKLGEYGEAFYKDYAPFFLDKGLLTTETFPSFLILCQVWDTLRVSQIALSAKGPLQVTDSGYSCMSGEATTFAKYEKIWRELSFFWGITPGVLKDNPLEEGLGFAKVGGAVPK